ncbi:hypothetical protein [uncultured Dokdonia sp.]|uniref:hypothetical protein n=1 Tax=uncultured Dokdonia sp. TaxID=575653 RepID=UPI00261669F8|nr:hypothetical protein [uncultured Dokdonia sp.]
MAQSITGTIYDDKTVVEGVVVKNINTKMATVSNEAGRFEIAAKAQDSISFQVFTHEKKTIVIKEGRVYTNFVVELTRKINQLDEVIIKKEKEFVFEEKELQNSFNKQMKTHQELYPEQYEFNSNPNANLNFVNIGKRLWKLIKKDKPKPTPFVPIKLDQYIGLFKEDPILTDRFLIETVKIPYEFKPLFIDFCVSRNIDAELLKEKNKFLLIEEFINLGKEFLEVLETDIENE